MVQEQNNYHIISNAIAFILENFKSQPDLDTIAEKVNLSPFHFQRIFTEWAGVSPKRFIQFLTVEYAKSLLSAKQATLFDAAYETGLSGTGRLHDLFIKIEGMTPGEFKNGGENLVIQYNIYETPFGDAFIASTTKGICKMVFTEDPDHDLKELVTAFPFAFIERKVEDIHLKALKIFSGKEPESSVITLHLRGTPFQLKVWEALLKIPVGCLRTYGQLAGDINHPKASRAVGSAVGDNPIAYIIPCHRVIQSSGIIGNYRWGSPRKAAMIGWEAGKLNVKTEN